MYDRVQHAERGKKHKITFLEQVFTMNVRKRQQSPSFAERAEQNSSKPREADSSILKANKIKEMLALNVRKYALSGRSLG